MSNARFEVLPNGSDGWMLWDYRYHCEVMNSAFREFVEAAKSRLMGETKMTLAEAFAWYGAKK